MATKKTLTEAEMAEADAFDLEAEKAEVAALYEAELAKYEAEKRAEEAKLAADHALEVEVQRMEEREYIALCLNEIIFQGVYSP
jgi:hypothetical protein